MGVTALNMVTDFCRNCEIRGIMINPRNLDWT
jgi:hypothetical protein